MWRRSMLVAFWLCPLLLVCHGKAADLSQQQESLLGSLVQSAADQKGVRLRLALFDVYAQPGAAVGEPANELKRVLEAESIIACQVVSDLEVQRGVLKGFDVILFPGGNAREQYTLLDETGREAVRQFVNGGGGYVGICAGAFLATKYGWGMGLVNARPLLRTDASGKMIPGSSDRGAGEVKMELTDAGRKLFDGPPGVFDARFSGGPIFLPAGSEPHTYVSLGTFRTEVWKNENQRGEMIGTPAIVAERFGQGCVILFSPHLESTKGVESLVRQAVVAARKLGSDS